MKKFLAIYQSTEESIRQMASATEDQKAAVMQAWMKWKEQNEDHIVDFGAPLMPSGTLGNATASGNTSGYSILQAESLESLKAACANHPHQDIEFLECISM